VGPPVPEDPLAADALGDVDVHRQIGRGPATGPLVAGKQRLPPDEVALLPPDEGADAGFDRVDVVGHVPGDPVALLHAETVDGVVPEVGDAEVPASLPEAVVDGEHPVHRHVQLPAQLADEADPEGA
jgi:hypothetical protein